MSKRFFEEGLRFWNAIAAVSKILAQAYSSNNFIPVALEILLLAQ